MIRTRTVHDDGSISIAVNKLEKTIRASDGTLQKMVSFDGEVWRLEAQENKEAVRLQRSTQLAQVRWKTKVAKLKDKKKYPALSPEDIRHEAGPHPAKKQTDHFNARHVNEGTGYKAPISVAVSRHGNAFLGKEQGKKHKYKRNLKRKPADREVPLLRPSHKHFCHGKSYVCACETWWLRRPCGGNAGCMKDVLAKRFKK
jgi:hypothetical protein